ncbi:MAG: DUF177 domain-containing protein [Bacillota bacterium]|nr:DUF177 domain-containing protein [Bacillota bacterium]
MKLYLRDLREMMDDRKLNLDLPMDTLEFQGDMFTPAVTPVLRLLLHREGTSTIVTGYIVGKWSVQCWRCLQPSDIELNVTFEDTWLLEASDEGAEDFLASAFVEDDGESINVLEYGREVLLEHLPMRVLCRTECLGLCSVCGANLNVEECKCGERIIDPRLAVLGRLLNDKGGVRDGTT